jgi:DNA primase
MSSASSLDAKQRVREAIDIVELIGDYIPLRREGRGYKGLCPWHDDSRPSLQVNPDRQSFRCWVCDIGGDIFSFIMRQENVDFPEALRMLADRAGITLSARPGEAAAADLKRLYFQAMAWAEQQYHDCLLREPDAEVARNYLHDRGLSPEIVAKFRLGYSPAQWSWLLDRARDTRFTPKVLEAVGLVSPRQQGPGHYDRFRGRVLFSIRDPQGRPVGLGGRVLPGTANADDPAKYVNSPESPLFNKSSLLYALDAAKEAMSRSGAAIVMEGYTDALIAQQCGFGNAVAVLGTALGERHLKLLRRHVDRVYLVLDGDEAGRRRTDQVLELFVAEQLDVRILTLPDELDPADFLLERGAAAFQAQLDQAVDALEHKFRTAVESVPADAGIHATTVAVEEVLATLAKAPRLGSATDAATRLREDQILHRLGQRSGLHESRLRQRLAELRSKDRRREPAQAVEPAAAPPIKSKQDLAERWLLEILLEQPAWLPEVRSTVHAVQFRCPRRRALFAAMLQLADRGEEPTFERLMLSLDDAQLKGLLVDLDDERQAKDRGKNESAVVAKEIRDLLTSFRNDQEDAADGMSATGTPDAGDDTAHAPGAALRALVNKQRVRQGISLPTDG